MKDVIVFCPDTDALVGALRADHPDWLSETLPPDAEAYLHTLSSDEGRSSSEYIDAEIKAWGIAKQEGTTNPRFLVSKTPTKRKGKETLALVRCRDGDNGERNTLAQLALLEEAGVLRVLGTWEEVQASTKMNKIYKRVYPRTPVTYTDDEGVEHEHTPPEEIGRFA